MSDRTSRARLWRLRHLWRECVCLDMTLPPVCFRVAFLLSNYVNAIRGVAWPSKETLAKRLGISGKTVLRSLKQLEARSYLQVIREGRTGTTNEYRLRFPDNPAAANIAKDNCVPRQGQIAPETRDSDVTQYKIRNTEKITALPGTVRINRVAGTGQHTRQRQSATATQLELAIASRLGPNGIDILGELHPTEVSRLRAMQRDGRLSDVEIFNLRYPDVTAKIFSEGEP